MKNKNNISLVKKCSGCGCCSNVCPHSAVSLKLNKHGFFSAIVDKRKCVSCGICLNVCHEEFNYKNTTSISNSNPFCYSSPNKNVLDNSSSGGFVTDLSLNLVKKDFSIIGTFFDYDDFFAKQCLINDPRKVISLSGSKYIQSLSFDTFNLFKTDSRMLVVGLPCQIAAFRIYLDYKKINYDNYIFVEPFCFGVSSYTLFKKYLKHKTKGRKLKHINFRSKKYGYHSYTFEFVFDDDTRLYSDQIKNNDIFYGFFKSRMFLNDSCYSCKYRERSAADIRVGDVWGDNRFENNSTGVTAIYSLTKKGDLVLHQFAEEKHQIIEGKISNINKQFKTENAKPTKEIWYFLLKANLNLSFFALKCLDKIKTGFKND